MTCIVGLVEAGTVYMGSDSAGADSSWNLRARRDAKVFVNGPFIFGFTSSFRMGQILRYVLKPPAIPDDKDLFEYMATEFIDAVRLALKAGGFATKDKDAESGGTFLVATSSRLFQIESDYQVGESLEPYDACGSGTAYAIGALFASRGHDPHDRVMLALRAAEANSAGVRGPFTVLSHGSIVTARLASIR